MGHTKRPLPGARSVSVTLSTANEQSDVSRTLTVMQWAQFVAHDISHTPVRKMGELLFHSLERRTKILISLKTD